ncbi:hypothetical protein ScPMuIL_012602 [Solemya velum]
MSDLEGSIESPRGSIDETTIENNLHLWQKHFFPLPSYKPYSSHLVVKEDGQSEEISDVSVCEQQHVSGVPANSSSRTAKEQSDKPKMSKRKAVKMQQICNDNFRMNDQFLSEELFGHGSQNETEKEQVVPNTDKHKKNYEDINMSERDLGSTGNETGTGCLAGTSATNNNKPPLQSGDSVFTDHADTKDVKESGDSIKDCRRTKSLPDLIQALPTGSPELEQFDRMSPDVIKDYNHDNNEISHDSVDFGYNFDDVNFKGVKYELEGPIHHPKKIPRRKPSFHRSVSFDPTSDRKWREKRESYRKSRSSGYGTGDNEQSLSQSGDGDCNLSKNSMDKNYMDDISTEILEYSGSLNQTFGNDNHFNTKSSVAVDFSGNLPDMGLFDFGASSESKDSSDDRKMTSVSYTTLPKFQDLLNDESICLTSSNFLSNSPVTEEKLNMIQQTYCSRTSDGSISSSKSSPGFSTNLAIRFLEEQSNSACVAEQQMKETNMMTTCVNPNYDIRTEINKLKFAYLMENFDKIVAPEKYTDFVKDLWDTPSTSPSEITDQRVSDKPLEHLRDADGVGLEGAETAREIHAEDVEMAYRCHDNACQDLMCRKVKKCVAAFEKNDYKNAVRDICQSLWEHCEDCCDELRCPIPWCQYLQDMDHNDCTNVEAAMKSYLKHPLMQVENLNEPCGLYLKLMDAEHHDNFQKWHVLTSLGHYRNTFIIKSRDNHELFILKKMLRFEHNQQITVYRRLLNLNHRYLLSPLWLKDYEDDGVLHVCSPFLKCGSLEEYLQERKFLKWDEAIHYMRKVLEAVLHLHRLGVIYLNWRSSNVLFSSQDRTEVQLSNMSCSVVKDSLCDVGSTRLSLAPNIVTPELLNAKSDTTLTELSDVWGAGCLLKEILTTKPVWHDQRHQKAERIWEIIRNSDNPPFPDRLTGAQKAVFSACWRKCPKDRISLEELREILNGGEAG